MIDWTPGAEATLKDLQTYELTGSGIVIHQQTLDCIAAALRRIEELESETERLKTEYTRVSGPHRYWQDRAEQAEAWLARMMEMLERTLIEAGLQAHKVGCPNRLMRVRLISSTGDLCPACDAEAILAAAQDASPETPTG